MSKKSYIPPKYQGSSFNCPHCHVLCTHSWTDAGNTIETGYKLPETFNPSLKTNRIFAACQCDDCNEVCLWLDRKLIYPDSTNAPPANDDLPDKIKSLYEEAGSILQKSPRASAALLRVALQHLCKELGGKGKKIWDDIDYLRKEKGLSNEIVKAMDIVRVVGNNAVHPGVIDIDDNPEIAAKLFNLINIIAHRMITEVREINEIHDGLPDSQKHKLE